MGENQIDPKGDIMLRAQRIDATQGNIVRMIVLYTVPLILSTLVQSLFNAVDIVVLGNMADSNAVASVGATTSIISLIVNTFVGLSSGTKVVLARQIGARDEEQIRKTVDTSLLSAVGFGALVAVVGVIFAPLFLDWTSCPSECYAGALLYIRIYVCAAPAILLYNYGSAVLSAAGDTQRPLYYILCCGLLNAVLNIILCLLLPQKVVAVAIATIAAQMLGAVLVFGRLCRMEGLGRVEVSKMRWNLSAFGKLMRFGVPIALSSSLYPLATLQIQSAVNLHGVSAIAGSSAAATIQNFSAAFSSSFGTTTTAFIGQNLGAQKHDRVKRSFSHCLWMSTASGGTIGVFLYLTGRFWLSLIVPDDPVAVDYGMIRMFYVTLFWFITCINGVISHATQAYGYSLICTVNSIVCVFGFRIFWMVFIYPYFGTFDMLMACFLVSWTLVLLVNIVTFLIVYNRYRKGKYKKI